jgi:iron complex transport system substrate-binding protein
MLVKGLKIIAATLLCLVVACSWAQARQIIDMTGRRVTVPQTIKKVYATSPPATTMLYALDASFIAGLNYPIAPAAKPYLAPAFSSLPVVGGWFGQGRTANLENLLKVRPDIVLMFMWRKWAVNQKSRQTMERLGFPVVHLVFEKIPDFPGAFTFLGQLLNRRQRALALNAYAMQTMDLIKELKAKLSENEKLRVYYAQKAEGLYTECDTSVHAELIPLCGGVNVHSCQTRKAYGMEKVSLEQVISYDPQVILTHDEMFYKKVYSDRRWKDIKAVKNQRVYKIPRYPLNWFDRPPSFMRLLGARWLINKLYPQYCKLDIIEETKRFYSLFLKVDLDEQAVRKIVMP